MKDYYYSISDYPNRKNFIGRNRRLYENNKTFIDSWLKKWNYLQDFTTTEQKLEWQCGADCKSVWDGIIQFRPSGITVKRPNVFPALVAPVQIPVIGKVGRRLTPREAARLQSRIPLYATKTIIGHTSRLIASLARRQEFCRYLLFCLKPAAYHAIVWRNVKVTEYMQSNYSNRTPLICEHNNRAYKQLGSAVLRHLPVGRNFAVTFCFA